MRSTNKKPTKASQVLDSLKADIATGVFSPGERLQMDALKERYGVGYSPLREALSRLASNGMVQMKDQCGFSVAPLSLDELYDLYQVRAHIDAMALELAMEHGDDQWEAEIVASWHQYEKFLNPKTNKNQDPTKWDSLQREFLFTLVKACKSPWLLKIREMLYDQSDRYRSVCLQSHHQNKRFLLDFIDENQRLVTAVLARNKSKALKIANEGWESSVKMIAAALTKLQAE